jgi:NAD+ diphosphatase
MVHNLSIISHAIRHPVTVIYAITMTINQIPIMDDRIKNWNHTAHFSAAFLEARYPEPGTLPESPLRVVVKGNGVYIQPGPAPSLFLPEAQIKTVMVLREQYLGHLDSRACYAVEVSQDLAASGSLYYPNVRDLYGILPDNELALASLAVRIIDFDRTTTFCGQCGAETRMSRIERAKICDRCGLITYPRTSPAIIVLVRNKDTILLARSPRFPPDLFSVIAGFVEPGETLEEAVHREVKEEVGIRVSNISYVGSEPWPFPHSLMLGFIADYAGGAITIDNKEIIAADWFDREHLPTLPSPMSISRALIEYWIRDRDQQ